MVFPWGPLVFLSGFAGGWAYSHYWEDSVVKGFERFHAWAESKHVPAFSWGTILLAIAVMVVSISYWLDHNRWNEFLDCQVKIASASVARSVPTAERDAAQTAANRAQRRLNSVLYDISQTIPLDGEPPTPREQQVALTAYERLGPVTRQAERAYVLLTHRQTVLDRVRGDNPLPDCGPSPG